MKTFYFLLLIILPLLFVGSFCQAGSILELNYPIIGGQTLSADTDLPNFVQYVFDFSLAISGLLGFGMLIFAGMKLLTSAGNPGAMIDAKDQIMSAFIGLLVLLCAWIILSTIDPNLVNIETPNIQSSTTTTGQ